MVKAIYWIFGAIRNVAGWISKLVFGKFALFSLTFSLSLFASANPTEETSETIVAEGKIVAFHKDWRHPTKPISIISLGTRADIWIVRVDRWTQGELKGQYFLVTYNVLEDAVSDAKLRRPRLIFTFRHPAHSTEKPCPSAKMNLRDFRWTTASKVTDLPDLSKIPCLLSDKPPIEQESSDENRPK